MPHQTSWVWDSKRPAQRISTFTEPSMDLQLMAIHRVTGSSLVTQQVKDPMLPLLWLVYCSDTGSNACMPWVWPIPSPKKEKRKKTKNKPSVTLDLPKSATQWATVLDVWQYHPGLPRPDESKFPEVGPFYVSARCKQMVRITGLNQPSSLTNYMKIQTFSNVYRCFSNSSPDSHVQDDNRRSKLRTKHTRLWPQCCPKTSAGGELMFSPPWQVRITGI